jgi:phosphinothricin acetyltransferase
MNIRSATEDDAAAIATIYGHHVMHGFGTFEETPPSAAQIARRIESVLAHGLPYLVAEDGGRVVGFAYAAPFRLRAAYRFTAEDSVYVHPDMIGRGVGAALLGDVVAACEAMGLRQLVAVIGDSENAGSIGLHRSLGFAEAGVGRAFGYKKGRWVDIVWMRKPLNGGDATTPTATGLTLGDG